MASSNSSTVREIRAAVSRFTDRIARVLEPVLTPLNRLAAYTFSSFFRFMIFFGFVLIALGAAIFGGTVAGHVGIYGVTSILIGATGRLIVRWKTRDATSPG